MPIITLHRLESALAGSFNSKADSQTKSLVPENCRIYIDSHQTPVRVGPPMLSSSVLPPSMRAVLPIKSISPPPTPWRWQWKHSHPLSGGLPQELTVASHAIITVTESMNLLQTVKSGSVQTGRCLSAWHPPSKTPVDVQSRTCQSQGKWPTRWTGTQSNHDHHKQFVSGKISSVEKLETLLAGANKATMTITSSLCPGRSQVLRSLRHYLLEQTKLRTSLHWLPWGVRCRKWKCLMIFDGKDEKGTSTIKLTLEPFQRQYWGNFWEGVEHIQALLSA